MIWQEKKALILADLHLGKVTHFRKAGIPLPKSVEKDNLDRFSFLLLNHEITRVIILGDLFHSNYNEEWVNFMAFLKKFPDLEFDLVMGNHDILSPNNYKASNLNIHKESLSMGPFFMTHIPELADGFYNICGHIHPSIKMEGKGLQRLRLSCFHFGEKQGVLPAFGAFTGTFTVSPKPEDDVFVVTDRTILKVL